jgi:NAD-dependent DNA ligase
MIEIPEVCPSCGTTLKLVNDQLFCTNKQCPAQTLKKLEHFSKTLKIKGLGPKTIEKLNFEFVSDIFSFSESHYVDTLGEKVGRKLYAEVQSAKSSDLATILEAFSIPLVGGTASKKISSVVSTIEDINEESCKQAGLGDKATANLVNWLKSKEYVNLPFDFKSVDAVKPSNPSGTKNITVCITGKLNDFPNRTEATKYLESLGFNCTSSVTKSTDILVDEEGRESSKSIKAQELGIPILTIKQVTERY